MLRVNVLALLQIKKAGCTVLLVQKSILRDAFNDLSIHFLAKVLQVSPSAMMCVLYFYSVLASRRSSRSVLVLSWRLFFFVDFFLWPRLGGLPIALGMDAWRQRRDWSAV